MTSGRSRSQTGEPASEAAVFSPSLVATLLGVDRQVILALSTRERHPGRGARAGFFAPHEVDALRRIHRAGGEAAHSQSEQVTADAAAKSQLLRLASHELRSPLAVLGGYLSMLEDGSLGPMPTAAREILPRMRSRINIMAAVIELMVEDQRLEENALALSPTLIDLVDLVRNCIRELTFAHIQPRTVEIVAPNTPVWIRGDRLRLTLIVNNLLDNALKYSSPPQPVRVSVLARESSSTLTVTDRGAGISAEHVSRLFQRFSRLGEEGGPGGLGLGLYVARQLALLHGGDLAVSSIVGEGTTFELTLPPLSSLEQSGPLSP